MTPIQDLMHAADATLLLSGWEMIDDALTGRTYARGNSVLTLMNHTEACVGAGYGRQRHLEGRLKERDLLVGYSGPDPICVISFRATVGADGRVRLSETVADATGQDTVTTDLPPASFAGFCETIAVRTDAEVARCLTTADRQTSP
jgi:hypothetical protein